MRAQRLFLCGVLTITFGAAWATPAAAATNLVTNPGFNTNRDGWTDPAPSGNVITTAWNRDDARGSATSGSFAVTNSNPAGSTSGNGPGQCIAVTPGAHYDLGVKIEVPGSQSTIGEAEAVLYFSSAPNCAVLIGSPIYGPPVSTSGGRFTSVALRDVAAPSNAQSVVLLLVTFKYPTSAAGPFTAQFDDVVFAATGGCVPSSTVLCLDGGRFAVSATFTAPSAPEAAAQAVALTEDTGYLWFFSANNVEVTVKVLNACSAGSAFHWVFVSGLTNVKVAMTVKDTQTGATKTYTNPQGQYFQPQFDTAAFACP